MPCSTGRPTETVECAGMGQKSLERLTGHSFRQGLSMQEIIDAAEADDVGPDISDWLG